ncbi:protein of unknown function [Hyphomicrobium sp. MC1]|nr:protein of unknown function [Hyphomicrobium sp. MC1]
MSSRFAKSDDCRENRRYFWTLQEIKRSAPMPMLRRALYYEMICYAFCAPGSNPSKGAKFPIDYLASTQGSPSWIVRSCRRLRAGLDR